MEVVVLRQNIYCFEFINFFIEGVSHQVIQIAWDKRNREILSITTRKAMPKYNTYPSSLLEVLLITGMSRERIEHHAY